MHPILNDSHPKLDLLNSLAGRVKTGTEHFNDAKPRAQKSAPGLSELVPQSERIEFGGAGCVRVTTRIPMTGERSPQGYVFPAAVPFALDGDFRESLAILARDPRWKEINPAKIAFIDTETTSLAGGSGTYAFLIGVGRYEGAEFLLHQYFMEDYTEEAALVEAVDAELGEAEALVSYNGRCFDAPLIQARWRMNRREPQFPPLHLDLLHSSRRLWRGRLADCRLGTIEREILGIMRFSDVESAAIPQLYFDYLKGIRRERMLPVLDHHAQDIISLGALLNHFAHALRNPADPRFDHANDQWGLARIFQAAERHDASIAALERAILAARDEDFGFRLSMHLARHLVRLGRFDEAEQVWLARAAQCRADRLDPLIELAKHAERRLKDFEKARCWTERALAILRAEGELESWVAGSVKLDRAAVIEALGRRNRRLEQRIIRASVL
ncbi:ribonuclease H-like domain-containing protein [Candidatus Sumerlaeota bacterium]|nr:ribonuclease H-like domain-containing protein [Candidatus Sumerlaeota bacterium]